MSKKVNGSEDIAKSRYHLGRRRSYRSSHRRRYGRRSPQTALSPLRESKSADTYCEVVEGMQFDRGYLSPYMVTDTDKMEAVIDDALVLITDKKISNIQEILPLLEQIVQAGKKLLIIAEDVEGGLLPLSYSISCAEPTCVAVKAPGFGDRRKEMLRDIAILTGGEVISDELGLELKDTTMQQLGRARQVKINKENTIIVGGAGDSEAIKSRVAQIRSAIETTTSDFDREAPGASC